jgi:hypothetical protein
METYTYKVELTVEVLAFDTEDAKTLLDDYLSPGPLADCIEIRSANFKAKR